MEEQNKNKIVVETYADDMADSLRDSQGSIIKKLIHGEEEDEDLKKKLSPESTQNRFFLSISIILIFIGVATLSFFVFNKDITTLDIAKQFKPLIFTDASAFLDVKGFSKEEVVNTILKEQALIPSKVKPGKVEGIYLIADKQVLGFREVGALMKLNFTPPSVEFMDDNFLIGVVRAGGLNETTEGDGLFILLKVRTFSDIFANLKSWENKLFLDFHDLFGIALSSETEYLLTKDFVSGVIGNKDARILYDNDNKIVLAYIFADDNSVVISNNENAVGEVILRLGSSQIEK